MNKTKSKPRWTRSEITRLVELAMRRTEQGERVDCDLVAAELPGRTAMGVQSVLHRLKHSGRLPNYVTISDPIRRTWHRGEHRAAPKTSDVDQMVAEGEPNTKDALGASETEELFAVLYRLLEETEQLSSALVDARSENAELRLKVVQLEAAGLRSDINLVNCTQTRAIELAEGLAGQGTHSQAFSLMKDTLVRSIRLLADLARGNRTA